MVTSCSGSIDPVVPPQCEPPDITADSLQWNEAEKRLDLRYSVVDHDLPQPTKGGLYWSTDRTYDAGDTLAYEFSIGTSFTGTAVGTYNLSVPTSALSGSLNSAGPSTRYLLLVVDPMGTITESSKANNCYPLRLPHIEVVNPANTTDFLITVEPAMPSITVGLNDVPASSLQSLSVNWHTEISSGPGDFDDQVATFAATPIDFTVTGSNQYQPNFGSQIIGGKLTFTAAFSVAGLQLNASSKDLHLRILGTQPDTATIEAYVRTKHEPRGFPAGGGFTYHDVLLRIMRTESYGGLQFYPDGSPVFNTTNDGGAGLFQITPPNAADVWDWHANVDAGVGIFNGMLASAISFIDRRYVKLAVQNVRQQFHLPGNTPVQVVPPPWSRDVMVLREAVQRYNSGTKPSRGAFTAQGKRRILSNGTTIIEVTWVRAGNGYDEKVLGALTP